MMTAKVKMKETIETVPAPANSDTSLAAQPDYRHVPWTDLQTSPTNPRRRVNDETIESLAESIRSQDILEPLIVRQVGEKYEIVCGERRYRAAKIAGVSQIPCLVRELTDEQVLDIQIHENLHREDVHPMDEAYGYQFLKEKLGCDVKELALRVGKTEAYVLNRLKLNLLIKDAQEDINSGYLPLTYALEIAKYPPEIQAHIYGEVYRKHGTYKDNDYVYEPVKGETVSWKVFSEWINTNIHRLLSKAPFSSKATNLRPDGLACIKCPERTGAVVSLFEPNQIGKKDACLNPECYELKTQTHIEVRRRELAELRRVEPTEVPLVRSWCYSDGKNYLGSQSAAVISGAKRGGSTETCDNGISAIDIEADNYGKTVQVCLKSTKCEIHWPEWKAPSTTDSTPDKSAEEDAADRLEAHRVRREEIWNAKIAEAVRVRVFKQAAENFEKKFLITDVGIDFLPQLIARFWRMTASSDSNNLTGVVKYLLTEWDGKDNKRDGVYIHDGRSGIEFFKGVDRGIQFRILFLLIHSHKGTIGHGNNYRSQLEVKELAIEFDVDYVLIDAEVRLEFSAKKHSEVHENYLKAIREKSEDAKIPHLFSDEWEAKD